MSDITIQRTTAPKPKPQDEGKLGFGKLFTDHMLLIDYSTEAGWHDARVVPYGPIELDPAATCLHYGQLIFEGLKAYRAADGRVVMFRPRKNMERINKSGERLCIPPIDPDFALEAVTKLVDVEKDWIPSSEGTSLYVRPFIISTDVFLGVHPAQTYKFITILSPSGPYYKGGMQPVRIWVEDEYVRSVSGGTGFTKCAGNYAASLAGQMKAEKEGYAQALWLDGRERKYVDEVGSMNIFFIIDGKALTPELSGGSILPGVTRDSVIRLLESWGVTVEERQISIQEIADTHKAGKLQEAFGTGTAAVISPVGELGWKDTTMHINDGKTGELAGRLYNELTGIQRGTKEDQFGWVYEVK